MIPDCDIITENRRHYLNILFPPKFYLRRPQCDDNILTELRILIAENEFCPGYPTSDMDESCNAQNYL